MQRTLDRLDYYYQVIHTTILSKQNAASGLMPASVAITTHGDYTDAWVRDNVYSIYAVHGLALAYRRVDDNKGRAFELEHAVVKLMRGLLFAMMRQAPKVEKFKQTQSLEHSLHAKYNTENGETVVGDFDWGHLQIDATSVFLLALADMTTSGITIIYTQDEVDFVQNLVFYIERAYRTPDYGIWERGNKSNHGQPELNSSSIGMALAALRAIHGLNLFGARGGPTSVIHVLPDELTRNATTLHSFLPRESKSKEIDGSVLSVIGFPGFAVQDPELIRRTKQEAKEKLEGRYGWKRFLRDGHQTEIEDTSRLHYNLNELKMFEDIESEWPLFFAYLILEGLFTGNLEQAEDYFKKIDKLVIDSTTLETPKGLASPSLSSASSKQSEAEVHIPLLAELYYVPKDLIEAEKQNPHSQERLPNDNLPLVWALSLYLLGCLIRENLLSPAEFDPLGRRLNASRIPQQHTVQIVLLSEDEALQSRLSMYGLETQAVSEIESSITVLNPKALMDVYAGLGRNNKLGLSGRPKRPIGVLGTSRLYRIQGRLYAFTPHFMDNEEFYLNSDPDYLVSAFESELSFTSKNWFYPGRPTMVVVLTNALLGNMRGGLQNLDTDPRQEAALRVAGGGSLGNQSKKNLLNFFMNLRCGECNGHRVRLCRLVESVTTSNIESLDFLINQPDMDWESILLVADKTARRRRTTPIHRKLNYDANETQASTPGTGGQRTPGSKTPRKRNSAFQGKSSLASPLDRLNQDSYFAELTSALSHLDANDGQPRFRLKEPEDSPVPSARKAVRGAPDSPLGKEETASPEALQPPSNAGTPPSVSDTLALNLGDPSQFQQAVESLVESVNLYDQVDLLQYLASCKPDDHYIPELQASIHDLLEEVYLKSMRLQYWSVARQAAGLLHKVVPSLTINITDIVIRQKQISIGSGPREYLISMPIAPDALKKMIADHCQDDIREGPVVQEIIIYLGSLMRTAPEFFDGILRLRTHYIIIALREEISRVNNCDEEEAVEHLMQLAPFELKSLLETILSGPDMCASVGEIAIRDNPGGTLVLSLPPSARGLGGGNSSTAPQLTLANSSLYTSRVAANAEQEKDTPQEAQGLRVRVQSAGFASGNFARVEINGNSMVANSRGIHVWAIDTSAPKVVLERASFDTHISTDEAREFKKFIDALAPGTLLAMAAKDDFVENLGEVGISVLEGLGSKQIRQVGYRDSYVFIGEKGGAADQVVEMHKGAQDGPTDLIEKHLSDHAHAAVEPHSRIADVFPTAHGRWLRRRKNDGALNRVPLHFFPKVWQILDSSQGMRIREHTLPRDPTVLEKTPEEFSFALAVESFLGWFVDPAERQIAVEVLTVISKLQERNPEMRMLDHMLDISLLMDTAVEFFWMKHIRDDLLPDTSYVANRDLAHKLFYDLPQQGSADSTFAYLAKSALKVLPFEFDYSREVVSSL